MVECRSEVGAERPDRPIRVFLLDDHEIVRLGLRDLIEVQDDLEVVGEAGDVAEALARIPCTEPDVAVLDVQLDDGTGMDVCRKVRVSQPEVRCLMLTSFANEEVMLDCIAAGAVGFVLKQIRGSELVDSIRAAAEGRSLVDPALVVRAAQRSTRPVDDPLMSSLTDRERSILGYLVEGMSNREIGAQLLLAEKTVKNYVSTVLMKLGMQSRTGAAVYAARHGISSSGD